MTARTEAERVAVLEEQLTTLKKDFESVTQKNRESIEELEKKISRYEWISVGVAGIGAVIVWALEKMGISFAATFDKK